MPETLLPYALSWDDRTQSFYFCDFFANGTRPSIFRYDFAKDKTYSAYIVGLSSIAFILPIDPKCAKFENRFVVASGKRIVEIIWDGKSSTATVSKPLFTVEKNDPNSVLSVGRQSEEGILFFGTISSSYCSGPANKSFYRYSKRDGVQRLFTGTRDTTGIATDRSQNALYHDDQCSGKITKFDLDSNGNICKAIGMFIE